MIVFYDKNAGMYCASEVRGTKSIAAWGETKELAIKRFKEID